MPRSATPFFAVETPAFSLADNERFLITALLDDSSSRARRRARILLDSADGKDPAHIARALNTRTRSIRHTLARFDEKRLNAFSFAALRRAQTAGTAPNVSPQEGIGANSTMREAARLVLKEQYFKLNQAEEDVRATRDSEAVHDMRVASRRLNSAFRLFRSYLAAKRARRLRKDLEELRDVLGHIRNLDVLIGDLDVYRSSAVERDQFRLGELAAAWQADRIAGHGKLVQYLDSARAAEWKTRMGILLEDDNASSSPRVIEVLPALVWQEYGTVRACGSNVRDATLEQLHALRISIKRLRYTLEFFREPLAQGMRLPFDEAKTRITESLIKPLVALQDQLGAIQDAVVAGQALTDFLGAQADTAKAQGEAAPDFRPIAAYHSFLQARISELRMDVPAKWAAIAEARYRRRLAQAVASI